MPMKKRYLKTKPVCKVTFELPKDAAVSANKVNIVGEFNEWDLNSTPMKRRKDGSFTVTLDLATKREYQYRYLIDGNEWENDWNADEYVPTPFGDSENSVVIL